LDNGRLSILAIAQRHDFQQLEVDITQRAFGFGDAPTRKRAPLTSSAVV
jgi:hypothetical protein